MDVDVEVVADVVVLVDVVEDGMAGTVARKMGLFKGRGLGYVVVCC